MVRTGPSKKDWEELGLKQKKRRSQNLFNELKKTADASGIDPVQMVGSLLHRYAIAKCRLSSLLILDISGLPIRMTSSWPRWVNKLRSLRESSQS